MVTMATIFNIDLALLVMNQKVDRLETWEEVLGQLVDKKKKVTG